MSRQSDALAVYFKSYGYKQTDVAETLGLSSANLSSVLHGRRPISAKLARKLADAYGFDVYFLRTGVGELLPKTTQTSQSTTVEQTDVTVAGDNIINSTVESHDNTLLKMCRELIDQLMQLRQENCDLRAKLDDAQKRDADK